MYPRHTVYFHIYIHNPPQNNIIIPITLSLIIKQYRVRKYGSIAEYLPNGQAYVFGYLQCNLKMCSNLKLWNQDITSQCGYQK